MTQSTTQKEKAEQESLKSTTSGRCKRNTHILDWDEARIIGSECNMDKRWIREAIEVQEVGRGHHELGGGGRECFSHASHTTPSNGLVKRPLEGGGGEVGGAD